MISLDQTPLAQAKASIRMEFTNGNIYAQPGPIYNQAFEPLKGVGIIYESETSRVNLTHPNPEILDDRIRNMLQQAFVGILGGAVEVHILEEPDE